MIQQNPTYNHGMRFERDLYYKDRRNITFLSYLNIIFRELVLPQTQYELLHREQLTPYEIPYLGEEALSSMNITSFLMNDDSHLPSLDTRYKSLISLSN